MPDSMTFEEILDLSIADKERLGLTHTPHEIAQQPRTWIDTFGIVKKRAVEIRDFIQSSGFGPITGCQFCVTLIGAGTSDYVGRAVEALLRKEWRCHVRTVPSTDMLTEMDDIVASSPEGSRQMWISFSRSGDSYEGVKVLEKALDKYPEISHLIVTCSSDGKMAADIAPGRQNVLCVVLADQVNDRGLAMTSSFTNMIVAGQCLAHISYPDRIGAIVEALATAASAILRTAEAIASETAAKDYKRICFLGSGALKAVADESALKVMELTAGYYSVMAESFLGLRHGPLSWLDKDSLVVGFLSCNPENQRIELGLIEELKRKDTVRDIVLISPGRFDGNLKAGLGLELNLPKEFGDAYRPPIDVLFAQLLGLFASIRRGLLPDAPSADGKIRRVVSDIEFAS